MAKIILPSDKRFVSLKDVWDVPKFKLFCFVVEAKELTVTNKSQVTCEARVERKVFGKTAPMSSSEPKWATLLWVGFDDPEIKTLVFDVYDKKQHLGEVRLSLPKAPKEALVDTWVPLKAREEGGKKPKDPVAVSGSLHIRYIFSAVPETRPNKVADGIAQEYFYKKNNVQFRSGDLIAYSGVGLLATATRLISNSEHSHVGLVVQIPNKWHGEEELYVLEVTDNLDRFIDPFAEAPRQGLVLFRLQERLHSFHGGLITHYPLKKPLESIPITDLADSVRRVHHQAELPKVINSVVTQFILRNFPFDAKKNLMEFVSLTGPKFISSALVHIAVLKENQIPPPLEMTVEWLKKLDIWDKPNLIRLPSAALKVAVETLRGKAGGAAVVKKSDPPRRASMSVLPQGGSPMLPHNPPPAAMPAPAPNPALMMNPGMPMPGYPAAPMAGYPAAPMAGYPAPGYPAAPMAGYPAPNNNFAAPAPAFPQQPAAYAAPVAARPPVPVVSAPPPVVGKDPALAAMEAEMKRLEEEAAKQARLMAEQSAKLEAEQRALEAAMLASEMQMKQLQSGGFSGSFKDEDSNSRPPSPGAEDVAAQANVKAMQQAGFNYGQLDFSQLQAYK